MPLPTKAVLLDADLVNAAFSAAVQDYLRPTDATKRTAVEAVEALYHAATASKLWFDQDGKLVGLDPALIKT